MSKSSANYLLPHKRISRRRVLFISRKWPPTVGGMETYSFKLAKALEKLTELQVLALSGRLDGAVPRIRTLFWFGIKVSIRLLFALKPAETVHVADMASWPLAYVAQLRSRKSRIVLSAHGTDVSFADRDDIRGRCYKIFMRLGSFLLKDCLVIANSACTAQAAYRCGFPRVKVVPLATDIRLRISQPTPDQHILFAGRLIPHKGCSWFIREVLPLLPSNIGLHIAGTVQNQNEERALINSRVTFLGPLKQKDLAIEYASALCVVVPNIPVSTGQFEGFGLVALEAAAAGGIVLAADYGGLCEAVIDNVSGFLISAGAAELWAEKVLDIAQWEPEKRRKFVSNAQPIIASQYSWKRVAGDTLRCYYGD